MLITEVKVKCNDCPAEWRGTKGTPIDECPWCHGNNTTLLEVKEDKKQPTGKLILG